MANLRRQLTVEVSAHILHAQIVSRPSYIRSERKWAQAKKMYLKKLVTLKNKVYTFDDASLEYFAERFRKKVEGGTEMALVRFLHKNVGL